MRSTGIQVFVLASLIYSASAGAVEVVSSEHKLPHEKGDCVALLSRLVILCVCIYCQRAAWRLTSTNFNDWIHEDHERNYMYVLCGILMNPVSL